MTAKTFVRLNALIARVSVRLAHYLFGQNFRHHLTVTGHVWLNHWVRQPGIQFCVSLSTFRPEPNPSDSVGPYGVKFHLK